MDSKYKRYILFALCVALLLLCVVINSVLSIGERLRTLHPAVEWVFYAAVLAVLLLGVVLPAMDIFTAPVFSLRALSTRSGAAKKKWCRRLVENIQNNTDLPQAQKEEMAAALHAGDLSDDLLAQSFIQAFVPQIDAAIVSTAKKVFLVTAISQTALFDTLGSLTANMNLVRKIVQICGFRPTNLQLVRLYTKVLSVAMLAAGLEEINMEELIGMLAGSSVAKLPGLLMASAAQGAANAFMTLRIGVATKYYLIDLDKEVTRKGLRRKTYKEALPLLKLIVTSTVKSVPDLFRAKRKLETL